ncbi:hypothetical protein C8R47DRAFT_294991 [Mycena vitilis]|nr:hypothetical protein C8R47DRAFT_294991 [Mycena vitilis]
MRYVPYRISVFSSTSLVGRHRCDDARAQGNAVLVWNPPRRHPASALGATAACADDTWLDSRCARGLKMARATRVHRQCGVTLVQVYNGCNSTAGCLGSDRDLTDVDHTIWVNRLCVEHRCDSADNVNSGRINYIGFHAFQPSRGGKSSSSPLSATPFSSSSSTIIVSTSPTTSNATVVNTPGSGSSSARRSLHLQAFCPRCLPVLRRYHKLFFPVTFGLLLPWSTTHCHSRRIRHGLAAINPQELSSSRSKINVRNRCSFHGPPRGLERAEPPSARFWVF